MRIVAALGGNALLRRGDPLDAAGQVARVRAAVRGLAALADGNELIVTHGNGPQVGLLAVAPHDIVAPGRLRRLPLPAGSMGPKAEAACRFAEQRPGAVAVIGALTEAPALVSGAAGTRVEAARPQAQGRKGI